MASSVRKMLDPADLDRRITTVTERALARHALEPIPTERVRLDAGDLSFQVRVLRRQLERKRRARQRQPADFNPFLPPDPELLVGEISPTHTCVLNKFNVLERHLLIVTREFEDQACPLTGADFDALARCLAGIDGLGFYNAGVIAGASQPHKHLQLVPPLGPEHRRAPIERVIPALGGDAAPRPGAIPGFEFVHAVAGIAGSESPELHGAALHRAYLALLAALDYSATDPYNLLATRDWMALVPRSREHFGATSINGLGFAGSLFVRDDAELAALRADGPLAALRAVAIPA